MDLCLYGRNHGVPAADTAAVAGLTPAQVERVYRDIDQKRRTTRYLHARPQLVETVDGGRSLMCGIAGVVNRRPDLPPPSRETLAAMTAALAHRGPDEFGIYRDRSAGLGHARLPIIDLATGQQPLSNEHGTLWISFNGEIFNYLELREDLEARGHLFRTRSDTEVIVHAYEEWGDQAFRRFNGQWALALWDTQRSALVLARDPFGVRPLYIAEHGGRLYFASEVKAIFAAHAGVPRRLDPVGLDQVFTFWTTISPRTVFAGIEELEPGSVRTYEGRKVRATRAWDPAYPVDGHGGFRGSFEDAVDEVREALERATSLRMLRSDVPVGSYLSGGLDSSLDRGAGAQGQRVAVPTFSLRFEDAEYDETPFQRDDGRSARQRARRGDGVARRHRSGVP